MTHQADHDSKSTQSDIQRQPVTLNQLASQIKEEEGDTDAGKAKDRALKMFCGWNV